MTTNPAIPVAVSGITDDLSVSEGGYHAGAVLSGGAVQCWGYNHFGQLGIGTSVIFSTPADVVEL